MTARAAIFFTPPRDSELARFAASWFGRDMAADRDVPRSTLAGVDAACQERITVSPRHYGFHATLKAPFELVSGATLATLHHAVANFVAGRRAVRAPRLELRAFHGFLALMLSAPCEDSDRFASDCVESFERFRAPLSDKDLARRRETDLTPRQDEHLMRWGYPYVFDEYHFHMTLTEQLPDAKCQALRDALMPHMAPFCAEPLMLDAVSLVAQADRGAPFTVVERFALRG